MLSSLSLSNNFNKASADEVAEQIELIKTWLRVAADTGAPVARIFGGSIPSDQRHDPATRAGGKQKVLDGIAAVLPDAEKLGVIMAIENHGGLPCTAEEQIAVIEHFGSPFLRATIDVGNYMACGQEGHEATAKVAPYCAYVHLKDNDKVPTDATPWGWSVQASTVGEGVVDLAACIASLKDAGYDGYVGLEFEGKEDETTGVPKSVACLNRLLD